MQTDEQHSDRSHIRRQQQQMVQKLNQSLLTQSYFILFLLIFLGLLVNATRGYGYNVAVGCGIYFISTKNPFLHRMFYFYVLVGLTMIADGIVISLLYGKVSVFHSVIAPVIEIILKLILLVLEGMRWFKESKQEKQRHKDLLQRETELRKEIEQKRKFQIQQRKYLAQKKDKQIRPQSYYQPKKYHNLEPNFKSQAYKEFDHQQFVQEKQNATQSVRH